MTQEKMRKVITACVSAATVLFVLLLGYLVYQWVTMAILNKRIAEAEEAEVLVVDAHLVAAEAAEEADKKEERLCF